MGLSLWSEMPLLEPAAKRAVVFIDGQNLFHHARGAFGYHFPNYDVLLLAQSVYASEGWQLREVCFYTGVPDVSDDARWHQFWTNKLASMRRAGVTVYKRSLRYRTKSVKLPDGTSHSFLVGEEKGNDVRLAIDVIGKAIRNEFDVAVVFSQDQDLSEVADEFRAIAQQQGRWLRIACAYPSSPAAANRRGINGTQWIKIGKNTYDLCIDPADYR